VKKFFSEGVILMGIRYKILFSLLILLFGFTLFAKQTEQTVYKNRKNKRPSFQYTHPLFKHSINRYSLPSVTKTLSLAANKKIDASLERSGWLSGTVVKDSNGAAVALVEVNLFDENFNWQAGTTTNSSGYFVFANLTPGFYKIYFDAASIPVNVCSEWYDNHGLDMQLADTVEIVNNQTVQLGTIRLANGGGLCGSVKADSNSLPIAQIRAEVYHEYGGFVTVRETNANGEFGIYGLPAGKYKLFLNSTQITGNYISEWYNDRGFLSDQADLLTIVPNQTVSGIHAGLAQGGGISGWVIAADTQQGIANVSVCIYDHDLNFCLSSFSSEIGQFSINGLYPGSYKIYFETALTAGSYVREWYNNRGHEVDLADSVTVTAGNTSELALITLDQGGRIEGTVKSASSLSPLENVYVWVHNELSAPLFWGVTDAAGFYSIKGIPEFNVKIRFDPAAISQNLMTQWYDNKGVHHFDADSITVSLQSPLILNTAYLNGGGVIQGKVTNATGSIPLAGIQITAYDIYHQPLNSTYSDQLGNYVVNGIPAGNIKIFFDTKLTGSNYISQWYNNQGFDFSKADMVVLAEGQLVTLNNARLEIGGGIAGCIQQQNTQLPIKNVCIRIMDTREMDLLWTFSDQNGFYSLGGIPAGNVKVYFDSTLTPGHFISEFYDQKGLLFIDGDYVNISAGSITQPVNAFLNEGGTVSGRVVDVLGQGIRDVDVLVFQLNNQAILGVYTDIQGNFTLNGIPEGNYKIYFDTFWTYKNYVCQWHDQKGLNIADADIVSIQSQNAVDLGLTILQTGGEISGQVTNRTGSAGLADVRVQLFDADAYSMLFGISDSLGNYSIRGVPAGNWKVYFFSGAIPGFYCSQWYNDQDSSFENADILSVPENAQIANINARLKTGGGIKGRVVSDADQSAIPWADIGVFDLNKQEIIQGSTDFEGYFSLNGILAGQYKVFIAASPFSGQYMDEWFDDQGIIEENADIITVQNGQFFDCTNIGLGLGGGISGIVTDQKALPLKNIAVNSYDGNFNFIKNTHTMFDGSYKISGLNTGSYYICFVPPANSGHQTVWYNNRVWQSHADVVQVTNGSYTGNINAVLPAAAESLLCSFNDIGLWRYSFTDKTWKQISRNYAKMLACGDFNHDFYADLIGFWPNSNAVYIGYGSGTQWQKQTINVSDLIDLAAGDLNGNQWTDIAGSWNYGVWQRFSADQSWQRLSVEKAQRIICADFDNDQKEDILGNWNGSIWIRFAKNGAWQKQIVNTAELIFITAGDLNGDHYSDIAGSWNYGVWWLDSVSKQWHCLSKNKAVCLACGDVNGDGLDDLIGYWNAPNAGLWVRYSSTGQWQRLSLQHPDNITCGRIN
jgi:hypothetical protein